MDEALATEAVDKTYGEVTALDGVSLSVADGEVFGLIGPNGAGKTTLVRTLTGTTTPDGGTVRVLGGTPADVDPERIGVLPQSFTPPERLTARELCRYYAGLYDRARDPDAVLADVGLDGTAADTWYENLSGGQRRRACVGATLVNDPDVLFLDEPTTGIDPAGRQSLWSLLADLAAGGTTIFLTSHSMVEVERLADRVGLLADGTLLAVGTPADLIAEYGGSRRLIVRTTDPPSDETIEALEDEGLSARVVDDDLVVEGIHPTDIGGAVAVIDAHGIGYESLTWTEPGLEEVYMELAGEQFEGGATEEKRAR